MHLQFNSWPGYIPIFRIIDNPQHLVFDTLPVHIPDRVKEIGLIPTLMEGFGSFAEEEVIASFMNRMHEYEKKPYDLKNLTLFDIMANAFRPSNDRTRTVYQPRLTHDEYAQWLPIFNHLKNKIANATKLDNQTA